MCGISLFVLSISKKKIRSGLVPCLSSKIRKWFPKLHKQLYFPLSGTWLATSKTKTLATFFQSCTNPEAVVWDRHFPRHPGRGGTPSPPGYQRVHFAGGILSEAEALAPKPRSRDDGAVGPRRAPYPQLSNGDYPSPPLPASPAAPGSGVFGGYDEKEVGVTPPSRSHF